MKSSSEEHPLLFRFLTNHAHVLACIAADPDVRLRDVAVTVGITERTAAQIVNELEQAGYLTKTREGREDDAERDARLAELEAQQAGGPPAGGLSDDMIEQLGKLGQLHEQGVLTDAEFDAQKQKLLQSA